MISNGKNRPGSRCLEIIQESGSAGRQPITCVQSEESVDIGGAVLPGARALETPIGVRRDTGLLPE